MWLLGLLHLEIIQERLRREFNLDLIVTPPSVIYKISKTDGTEESIHNPAEWPQQTKISEIKSLGKASIFLLILYRVYNNYVQKKGEFKGKLILRAIEYC